MSQNDPTHSYIHAVRSGIPVKGKTMTAIEIKVNHTPETRTVPPANENTDTLYFAVRQLHAALSMISKQWDDCENFDDPTEVFNLVEMARKSAVVAIEEHESSASSADDWIEVGEVGVDAGLLMVGDPCYIGEKSHPAQMGLDKFHTEVLEPQIDEDAIQLHFDRGHAGLGVIVPTGFGDGVYPVYIRRDKATGRVAEVKVTFIE